MKNLRNISIYYIIIGILCAISFVFFQFWRLSVLGGGLFAVYVVLYLLGVKKEHFIYNEKLRRSVLFIAYLLPLLLYFLTYTYRANLRAYKVILPDNLEGLVTLPYIRDENPNIIALLQAFSLYPADKIKVDKEGNASSNLIYNERGSFKFIGISAGAELEGTGENINFYQNGKKLKVHLGTWDMESADTLSSSTITEKHAYYFDWIEDYDENNAALNSDSRQMRFVITKPKNYHTYFLNEKEKIELRKKDSIEGKPYYSEYYDDNILRIKLLE